MMFLTSARANASLMGILLAAFAWGQSPTTNSSSLESPVRLPRNELRQYRDSDGQIKVARSPRQWQARRREILVAMHSVMGDFPDPDQRIALKVEIQSEVD